MIRGNIFSEIVGCPSVDTGLIYYGVATTVTSDKNSKTFMRNYVMPSNIYFSQNYPTVVNVITTMLGLQYYNYIVPLHIKYLAVNEIVQLYVSEVKQNKYYNLSMGVGEQVDKTELPPYGSLFKFVNVLALDMVDEYFLNIGAFTVEHL